MTNVTEVKKEFQAKELLELGLPYEAPEGGSIISDKVIDNTRWSVVHEIIFRLPGMREGQAWRAWYSVGATEQQYESAWEYETIVTATLVHEVEVMVRVWKPVEVEA